ncbi:MAG: uracil-DNA glycosylase [Ktedonobacterales bacterium]
MNDVKDVAQRQLDVIAEEVKRCQRCDLYIGARQAVPGSGNPRAEVMLVGEAPSAYDDRRGYPFSGPSGKFLDELLEMAGLNREAIYLTNMVRHRVPGSRELTPAEIGACAGYLTRQIAAIDPLVLVALGRGALARLLPGAKISSIHGQAKVSRGRIVVAMYNPAAALHREELRETVVSDFKHALPAALAEAHRLAALGKIGSLAESSTDSSREDPQQLSLF